MDKLIIEGGSRLRGAVTVSGAKNAALPILAATLLCDEPSEIHNVPSVADVHTMVRILKVLGVAAEYDSGRVSVRPNRKTLNPVAPYRLVKTMRASICLLGPLLAKAGHAQVAMPGGCVIGPRPVDLHIKGLRAMGAGINVEHGDIVARAKPLTGTTVYLGGAFGSSVLATANIMMAATLARGTTVIENAASEPEVVDLAECLISMGAKIRGARTHTLEIEGVKRLHGTTHTIIPDRIEAGTWLMAGAMTGGSLTVKHARAEHLGAVLDTLRECGVACELMHNDAIHVTGNAHRRPADVTTLPYPGFPTDLQAQMMSLMAVTDGISVITEKIFPDRFIHIAELNRMGADIQLEGPSAIVKGVRRLSGAPVMASDLRASAALVLAGLVANRRTEVSRVYHLDRGYEGLERKLSSVGANIWRERE